jgi:pyruvate/2-oxoglutarate dehydrogenase complex dihydrolipoamide dehydrogenase (E3) component
MGGDCLNYGCVPSKTLIRSGRALADVSHAKNFGVLSSSAQVDFKAVMERVRRIRAQISPHDSAVRCREAGVDVFLGEGRFTGMNTLEVAGQTLRFSKAVIATGARVAALSLPGLESGDYLTNETVFALTERPRRLAVIGGGPIGCELSQVFQRLGCAVTLFHDKAHILDREDAQASEIVKQVFLREGIRVVLEAAILRVDKNGLEKAIYFKQSGKAEEQSLTADAILVGVGRVPNVDALNLERAGVAYDQRRGVHVNDRLATSNPRIFAAGDICLTYKFTHTAEAAAKIVLQNALFGGHKHFSDLTIPWCTYTDPEIAHVGAYAHEAEAKGIPTTTFTRDWRDVDRATTEGEDAGFVKLVVKKDTDRILGATIVGRHAGDMISEITLAMAGKIGLGALANVIHPYPTLAEAIQQAAAAYQRSRLTPWVKKVFQTWLKWNR